MGWILDWLSARWDRVQTAFDYQWGRLNDYLINLYGVAYTVLFIYGGRTIYVVFTFWINIYYLMVTAYDRAYDFWENLYANARDVVGTWYGMAYVVLNQYKNNVVAVVVTFYGNVYWFVVTSWLALYDFGTYLYVKTKALTQGFWDNVVESFQTHWPRLFYIINDGYSNLYWTIHDAPANLRKLAGDWFTKIDALVNTYDAKIVAFFTTGYASLQTLINDDVRKINDLLNTSFPALAAIVASIKNITSFLTSDIAGKILSLTQTWYGQLTTFLQNPGAYIFAYIEAYVYPWGEGVVAEWLGAVAVTLPPRQSPFGTIAPPLPGGGAPPPGSTGKFIYPEIYHTLSGYDFGPDHPGLDFRATLGLRINASAAGIVQFVGDTGDGYGIHVDLDHGGGFLTRYAHFSGVSVVSQQNVIQGQQIGLAGSTGHSTGPHLHFEIRLNSAPLNPWLLLPAP